MNSLVHIATERTEGMLRKLIRRLVCKKEDTSNDVNAFKESENKTPKKE
ncbi:MAG: hypothetical protein WD154_04035 [Nitrosopumilaceae archaeon]